MPTQLTLDFTVRPQLEPEPAIRTEHWLDLTGIARGVGFTTVVQVSLALIDALEPLQHETDADYDQRLYDALWRAHFQLSLDHLPYTTFNFNFNRMYGKPDEMQEIRLRLHAEIKEHLVYLGRLEDF